MFHTLTEKLREVAGQCPQRVAILYKDQEERHETTYGDLVQSSLGVAAWLRARGGERGDRMVLILENRPQWPMCYFGILFAGGVAVPVDVQSKADLITYILRKTQPSFVFTSSGLSWKNVDRTSSLKGFVTVGGKNPTLPEAVPFSQIPPSRSVPPDVLGAALEDLASIIFTSGTTGPPKGVMLTHKNLYANFLGILRLDAVTDEDNFLSVLPLHHSFPFMANLVTPLFCRARITCLSTLRADVVLQCLKDENITVMALTPQVLQFFHYGIERRIRTMPLGLGRLLLRFLDHSWNRPKQAGRNLAEPILSRVRAGFGPRFRFFVSGGAKLDETLTKNFFKLGLVVLEGYGLTEASPVVSINPPHAPRIGSVGKPLRGVEVRISRTGADKAGEILIRGENVMKGYYRDEQATREAVRDGWLHSGDLGFVDQDGYLFVQGRIKDLIVLSSGKNVSSEEVAAHYAQAPSIKEIFVTAAPAQDRLVALVVPDFQYFRDSGETDVYGKIKWDLEYYSEKIESYKRIRGFVLYHKELPKTRLGKIERHKVEQIYREKAEEEKGERKPPPAEDLSHTARRVLDVVEAQTGIRGISLEDHLELTLGLDSLGRIGLLTAIEKEFQFHIEESRFHHVFTVEELVRLVESEEGEGGSRVLDSVQGWVESLQSSPPNDLLHKIGVTPGWMARAVTLLMGMILDPLFSSLFRLRVHGREHLTVEDGCIVSPNHASYMDGFLIFSSVPFSRRLRLYFQGYRIIFENPVIRGLLKHIRVIPVDSARSLTEAMQASAHVLRQGKMLCVFPEGARTVTGKMQPFKKGVAVLAKELNVRVVPARIVGSYEAWSPVKTFPRPFPIEVHFGRPHSWQELRDRGLELDPNLGEYDAVALGLREEVLRLGPGEGGFVENLQAESAPGGSIPEAVGGIGSFPPSKQEKTP